MRVVKKGKTKSIMRTMYLPLSTHLVEEDEEDDIIPEAAKAIHGGHLDDEGEDVVDEGVEGLVGEHAPRQVSHRLKLIIDEELWRHHDEACGGQNKGRCCYCQDTSQEQLGGKVK